MILRRRFLGAFAVVVAERWMAPASSLAATNEETPEKIRWRVPVAHVDTVMRNLRFEGTVTNDTDEKGAPLIFIFVGTVLLIHLAEAVLALRREIVYGGLVIDTRGPEIVIQNDPRLDGGVIVLVTPNGAHLYERNELDAVNDLVTALLKVK
jgi:hypothetical protein